MNQEPIDYPSPRSQIFNMVTTGCLRNYQIHRLKCGKPSTASHHYLQTRALDLGQG